MIDSLFNLDHLTGNEIFVRRKSMLIIMGGVMFFRLVMLALSKTYKSPFSIIPALIGSAAIGGIVLFGFRVARADLDLLVIVAFILTAVFFAQTFFLRFGGSGYLKLGLYEVSIFSFVLGIPFYLSFFFLISMDYMPQIGLGYLVIQFVVFLYWTLVYFRVNKFPDPFDRYHLWKEKVEMSFNYGEGILVPRYIKEFFKLQITRSRKVGRFSLKTGLPMHLETRKIDFLSNGQKAEESLGVCTYDVWRSEQKEDVIFLKYDQKKVKGVAKCYACNFNCMELTVEVLKAATYDENGIVEKFYTCKNCCEVSKKKKYATSKKKRIVVRASVEDDNLDDDWMGNKDNDSTSSGSSFGGWSVHGSSSSSSWGGGSFGGGGSSSKW